MARRSWTSEDCEEIRRRWRFGFTYAEIGQHFGVSAKAVGLAVRRSGIIDPREAAAAARSKGKGRPKPAEVKQKLSRAQAALWTPERRRRASETVKAYRASERGRTEMQQTLQIVARNKRGFDVPDHLRDEYRFLRRSKSIPAREAGAILGLIPQATGGR